MLVSIDMKPALSPFFHWSGIPAKRQALQSPTGEFHQVLLQRTNPKSILDFELLKFAVRSFGVNYELSIPFKKSG